MYQVDQYNPAIGQTATAVLLAQINGLEVQPMSVRLRGRGAAKKRQLNRLVAHRDGTFSVRIGKHWIRHIRSLNGDFPPSHTLREGWALGLYQTGQLDQY
jgi:hypothetical protein